MAENIPERVKDCVLSIEPDARIVLFGSRARGDFHRGSDWDFLVLVEGVVDTTRTDRIRHALYEIEWETGEVISAIVRSHRQWEKPEYRGIPLHQTIDREGVSL
jgi:predicted nucleotidyltransferase